MAGFATATKDGQTISTRSLPQPVIQLTTRATSGAAWASGSAAAGTPPARSTTSISSSKTTSKSPGCNRDFKMCRGKSPSAPCHSERSEESVVGTMRILRCAQNDSGGRLPCLVVALQSSPPGTNLLCVFLKVVPGRTLHPGSHVAVPLIGAQRRQQSEQVIVSCLEEGDRFWQREGLEASLPLVIERDGVSIIFAGTFAVQVDAQFFQAHLFPVADMRHHVLDRPFAHRAGYGQLLLAQSKDGRGERDTR